MNLIGDDLVSWQEISSYVFKELELLMADHKITH